jgi:phenylalanyl-tRNA synthetase alpha chain
MFRVYLKGKSSDTFYINEEYLLRTQTSAHQNENLKKYDSFCVFADVYRRDQIDATHYPVFHQMEGVRIYTFDQLDYYIKNNAHNLPVIDKSILIQNKDYSYDVNFASEKELIYRALIVEDMKKTHENLIRFLLNDPNLQIRWIEGYFPFTEPSYELEAFFNGKWVEMLGCGDLIRSNS